MDNKIKYQFCSQMWQYNSPNGWYFISIPKGISKEIRSNLKWQEEGWGRMKAIAEINQNNWKTAIWFDTKLDTYILPIKSEIRKSSNLTINTDIIVQIYI